MSVEKLTVRLLVAGLLVALAAVLRAFGVAVVLALMIAASVVLLDVVLLRFDLGANVRRMTFAAFGIRWALALFLYSVSLYEWPFARSLQVGDGFWSFAADAVSYHVWGSRILAAIARDLPLPDPGAAIDYHLIVAGIYALFGSSPLTAIAVNILAWTLGTVLLVDLFTSLRSRPLQPWLVAGLSFWPSGLLWPTQLMKDSLVFLFFVIAARAAVRFLRARSVESAAAAALVLALAFGPLVRLRWYIGQLFFMSSAFAAVAGALLSRVSGRETWREAALAGIVAALSLYGVLFIAAPDPFFILGPNEPAPAYVRQGRQLERLGDRDAALRAYEHALSIEPGSADATVSVSRLRNQPVDANAGLPEMSAVADVSASPRFARVGRIADRLAITIKQATSRTFDATVQSFSAVSPVRLAPMRRKFAERGGGSEFGVRRALNGWADVIQTAPLGIAAGLFAPYPWDVVRPRGLTGHFRTVALSESLMMIGLLPAIVLGLSRLRRIDELFLATLAFGGVLGLGLVVTNVGTLFRLREVFVLSIVAFGAYGPDAYALSFRRIRNAYDKLAHRPKPAITSQEFVLIDAVPKELPTGGCVAYWSEVDVPAGYKSIPAAVDANAADLRREYVAWTHDVGAFEIAGRTVRAHLALWPEFSIWWLGLIPEKTPFRTRGVYNVFKIRVLERMYFEQGCRGLLYVGRDRALHLTLRRWCRQIHHPYRRVRGARSVNDQRLRSRVIRTLPHVVQAIGYLIFKWWTRYRHVGAPSFPTANDGSAGTIITFFPNVDLKSTRKGRFRSRYWEQLHDVLDELPMPIRWIWLYVDSTEVSFAETIKLRDVCNAAGGKYQHVLLDQYASPRVIARALRLYFRSCLARLRLTSARQAFRMPGSALNFFPILANDWNSSLAGIVAMDGALLLALFDEAATRLGPSKWTLYVWENQPWELAALVAWRRHRNGRMVGVQHATLLPLDLRAFVDPRELDAPEGERRPIPDLLAVNGSGARDLMLGSGFPPDQLTVTEAVRYSYLKTSPHVRSRPERSVLIATGFRHSEVAFQLKLVEGAARCGAFGEYSRVIFKAHPFCPIDRVLAESELPFPYEIEAAPLADLWATVDVAFVANSTSTAAEALYLRIPTAICAPADEMNLSPAFGCEGIIMVSSAAQLHAFLRDPQPSPWPADYLELNEDLPKWRRLLTV